jgi:hypothetical protein
MTSDSPSTIFHNLLLLQVPDEAPSSLERWCFGIAEDLKKNSHRLNYTSNEIASTEASTKERNKKIVLTIVLF